MASVVGVGTKRNSERARAKKSATTGIGSGGSDGSDRVDAMIFATSGGRGGPW